MVFSDSLKKTEQFHEVYHRGRSVSDPFLVVYTLKNGTDTNRLGISVSKKVGNSVIRHHLTRLIREVYRLHESMFRPGWDIVVVVRQRGRSADYHRIERSLLHLAELSHLLTEETTGQV